MLDDLYENIGSKIKNWAKWIFIVVAIGAVITGITLMCSASDIDDILFITGILTTIFGPMATYVGSWILYAFGELVEDIHAMRIKYYLTVDENAKYEEVYERETKKREMHENVNKDTVSTEKDDDFIYTQCKNCKKEFAFQKGMRKVRCPWCNTKQD